MSFVFEDDFRFKDENGQPYNWSIEKNSSVPHSYAVVKDGAYVVLLSGNRHFATIPPLRNFEWTFGLKTILAPRTTDSGCVLYFRYDRCLRSGYALTISFRAGSIVVELGILRDRELEMIDRKERPVTTGGGEWKVGLSAAGNHFTLCMNGESFELTDSHNVVDASGAIGFDKTDFKGELVIREPRVLSNDPLEKTSILEPLVCAFPCVNGMSVPVQYAMNLSQYADGLYELEVDVTGGIPSRSERKQCGGWCYEIDRIRTPYLRLETPRGEFKHILLSEGLTTLFDRDEKRPFPIIHGAVEWPLKRKVYFSNLPDPTAMCFAFGYEDFENDPIRYAAGALELILDATGRLLYQGPSLRKGRMALNVESPADKRLCDLIPAHVPDRDKALAHARNNHYFLERERIRFTIRVHWHESEFCESGFSLKVDLQNVFGDTLKQDLPVSSSAKASPGHDPLEVGLGIKRLSFQVDAGEELVTGVYQLALVLSHSSSMVSEETVLFEVLSEAPDAIPPPIASGLPWLYSEPYEVRNLETDAFDPWSERAGSNNAEHYFSMNCFFPHCGREKEVWNLLGVYKRKWFLRLTGITCGLDSRKIEDNRDVIAHCDFLDTPHFSTPTEDVEHFYLSFRGHYKYTYLELVLDFIRRCPDRFSSAQLQTKALEKLIDDKACLPEEAFVELLEKQGEAWADYVSEHLPALWESDHAAIKSISGQVTQVRNGPFPVYFLHPKTAYFMKYIGLGNRSEVERNYDGFFQFEDYPFECGYPSSQAVFTLMTIKLHYPKVRLFPEIYDSVIEGCNDGALALAHPPYGTTALPPFFTAKRVVEFCFGAMWYQGGGYHFWNDNGFHFRSPNRERVNEFVTAWGKIRKLAPRRPIRTSCFLFDLGLIADHRDCFERARGGHPGMEIEIYNTAEEALSYAYLAARQCGLPGGFVTARDDLSSLSAEDMDLLIIPPLGPHTPKSVLDSIRNLHRQGVNLLGFEEVSGLEELFGVKPAGQRTPIRKIGFAADFARGDANPSTEYVTAHKLCVAACERDGAFPVLLGAEDAAGDLNVPVLSMHQTQWGETAFFHIPPTMVNREPRKKQKYGCECLSPVIREAFAYVLKRLSRPFILAENGSLIAFHDRAEATMVAIVEEDSDTPEGTCPPPVMVRIARPNMNRASVACDQEYYVARETAESTTLRIILKKHESAILRIHHNEE